MTSPVFVCGIMFLCLHLVMLDCDVGTALLVNWLVIFIFIGCEIQFLFLIHGMAEGPEEQIPEWLHLCFSSSLCFCGCKDVECL